MIPTWRLRAAFARRLSAVYGTEVPAYTTLLDVTGEVNDEVARRNPDAGRLGGLDRVTAERHGAIRVGTPRELRQAAQVFAALGMRPVGFYDLRDATTSAVPVVSTAFRPVDPDELARNPFRVFTSLLTTADRRFFDAGLQARLEAFLARRTLFPPELLTLAARAEREHGLAPEEAERFLALAVDAFALSPEPVDRAWYAELARISAVAADIGGVTRTHLNHLTPRVLDIDALYRRMADRGVTMIDEIQGPPRWDGPDVLLRQTSFRALDEPRRFREPDGSVTTGTLRVRFGEVEARGIALSRAGRARYDALCAETDRRLAEDGRATRQDVAREVWEAGFPREERLLAAGELAFFTFHPAAARPRDGRRPPADLAGLLDDGWLTSHPIVYEDFLPRSAAGIFRSNLAGQGTRDAARTGTPYDEHRLSAILERPVHDPFEIYAAQQDAALRHALEALGADDARRALASRATALRPSPPPRTEGAAP
ncbi:2-oxoadipate dioxygenase/decarboxylase family protein [Streptomyces sp. NPDC017529]|uniref:2-oxoadipate dioxygenase/decarboxylase n=1 Tax=Streptomyces sp. NPDC017529 TaxID=3365000 RepID=UPI0037A45724